MRRAIKLQQNAFDRATGAGTRFKYNYTTYESLGYDRQQGSYFCVEILGRNKRSEPIPFELLKTRKPRRIIEDFRMYRGSGF